MERTLKIPYAHYIRNLKRNTRRKHWRVYRNIRGKCERLVLPDGSVVFPRMEYAGKTRFNAYKTRRNSMRAVPFYTKKTFPDAPDGIYAWIDSDKGFYAAFVRSKTEHGTRHAQIADRVSATEINLAGEIEKTGRNIIFNFYSGTFMWDHLDENETEENLRKEAMDLFTSMGLVAEYGKTREELIQNDPSLEELEAIKKIGYNIYLYKSKPACESHGGYFYAEISPEYRAELEAKVEEYTKKVADYTDEIAKFQETFDRFKRALERELPEDLKKGIEEAIPHMESRLPILRKTLDDAVYLRNRYATILNDSDRSYRLL